MQVVLLNWQHPTAFLFAPCCQALGGGKTEDIVMQTSLFQEPPCFNLIPYVRYFFIQIHFI